MWRHSNTLAQCSNIVRFPDWPTWGYTHTWRSSIMWTRYSQDIRTVENNQKSFWVRQPRLLQFRCLWQRFLHCLLMRGLCLCTFDNSRFPSTPFGLGKERLSLLLIALSAPSVTKQMTDPLTLITLVSRLSKSLRVNLIMLSSGLTLDQLCTSPPVQALVQL